MKYKTMLRNKLPNLAILLILSTLLTTCTSQTASEPLPPTETPISIPGSPKAIPSAAWTPTVVPVLMPTPVITATPIIIEEGSEEKIKEIVEKIYKVGPQCRLDLLRPGENPWEVPSLNLNQLDIPMNQEKIWVWEIADNPSKTFRAFVACERELCHPKLYLENLNSGTVQEIDWSGRFPYRPISQIIWIGDDLLSFMHLTSPNDALIITHQIDEGNFLVYWLVGYSCK